MKGHHLLDVRTNVLKWSQQKLADQLGYSRNSISRMELDKQPIEQVAELAIRWLVYRECQIVCPAFDEPEPVQPVQHHVAEPEKQHHVAKTIEELASESIYSDDDLLETLAAMSSDFAEMSSESVLTAHHRFNALFYSLDSYPLDKFVRDFYLTLSPLEWCNQRMLVSAWRKFSGDKDFTIAP